MMLERIRHDIIGNCKSNPLYIRTPFGSRPLVYADWVASGRGLNEIESYIRNQVLMSYGNTHTQASHTGQQTSAYRQESRQIIAQTCNANRSTDVVLFTGTGTTAAVNKLVEILGLASCSTLKSLAVNEINQRPVIFVGPFEHHSNLLPWRESIAEVISINENKNGSGVDLMHLKEMLLHYQQRPLRIGAFSAASNVTGVLEDVDTVTSLLHQYGALSVWDYACAAPYCKIDMNPVLAGDDPRRPFVNKDAIYFSPHKFLGGVATPGVLIVKKSLINNQIPSIPHIGGGTVFFVSPTSHRYLFKREEREEGGTPDIVGSIRVGLCMQARNAIGIELIDSVEQSIVQLLGNSFKDCKNIVVLGPKLVVNDPEQKSVKRLPIISFLIRDQFQNRFLHHNFVAALLNDLYGIQARGGCLCAGPYVQSLLGLTLNHVEEIENLLVKNPHLHECLRPGVTRVSFSFAMQKEEIDYIIQAIKDISEFGWRLLPFYRFDLKTGIWQHTKRFKKFSERRWLGKSDIFGLGNAFNHINNDNNDDDDDETEEIMNNTKAETLEQVDEDDDQEDDENNINNDLDEKLKNKLDMILKKGKEIMLDDKQKNTRVLDQSRHLNDNAERFRWFTLPSEAYDLLCGNEKVDVKECVIQPKKFEPILLLLLLDNNSKMMMPDIFHKKTKQEEKENSTEENVPEQKNITFEENDDGICTTGSCFLPRSQSKYPLFQEQENKTIVTNSRQIKFTSSVSTNVYHKSSSFSGGLSSAAETAGISTAKMRNATLFPEVPSKLMKSVRDAIAQFEMIQPGDRLLLGLSGGKDSLALLHILLQFRRSSRIPFTLSAATVDPGTEAFDPTPLIPYMKSLGVEYFFLQTQIFDDAGKILKDQNNPSYCAYCARMKRGSLYGCCRENNFNVLVLAQHLDDIAESFFMSLFHTGCVKTMFANYPNDEGDVRIIRPLVLTRELETKKFSYDAKLPVINENCPACFEAPQERARIKKVLAREEIAVPDLFSSLKRALIPFLDQDTSNNLRNFGEQIRRKSMRKSQAELLKKKDQERSDRNKAIRESKRAAFDSKRNEVLSSNNE